jgi:hypothetical protein
MRRRAPVADLETSVRKIIAVLRMRYRVIEIPQADDEAVAAIVKAAGSSGTVTTAVISSDAAVTSLQARVSQLEELAGTILGTFRKSPNGWNARAKLADMDEWQQRLGERA